MAKDVLTCYSSMLISLLAPFLLIISVFVCLFLFETFLVNRICCSSATKLKISRFIVHKAQAEDAQETACKL